MLMKWEEFLVSSKERSRNWTERLGLEMNTFFCCICFYDLIILFKTRIDIYRIWRTGLNRVVGKEQV